MREAVSRTLYFWPLPFRERPIAYLDARFFFRTTAVRLGR